MEQFLLGDVRRVSGAEAEAGRGEHLHCTLVYPTGGERVWGQGGDESANSLLPT